MVHVLGVSWGQEGAKSAGIVLEDCGKQVKTLPLGTVPGIKYPPNHTNWTLSWRELTRVSQNWKMEQTND